MTYVAAMRAYNAGEIEKRMRSWTLPFLIRHSAFHTLDHAWEMEDKDLFTEARPDPPSTFLAPRVVRETSLAHGVGCGQT